MTGKSYVYSVIHIYLIGIFNFSIQFIWFNATYITINFYRTILLCDCDIRQHTVLSQMNHYMVFRICMQRYDWNDFYPWILSFHL